MNVIFLGPPGAGKGTLAAKIKDAMNLTHLSTGDMLREEMKQETELGKMAKGYISEGKLVPDSVIIGMVKGRLESTEGGVLFDGFPRTVEQAKALDEIATIDSVINLATTVDVVIKRICSRRICKDCGAVYNTSWHKSDVCSECGGALYTRADDNEETVAKRFDVYMSETAPLIEYYEAKGVVTTVDANRPLEEKVAEITQLLGSVKA